MKSSFRATLDPFAWQHISGYNAAHGRTQNDPQAKACTTNQPRS
jgi:hypothetical protein